MWRWQGGMLSLLLGVSIAGILSVAAEPRVMSKPSTTRPTGLVYHPDFLLHDPGPDHPERPARLQAMRWPRTARSLTTRRPTLSRPSQRGPTAPPSLRGDRIPSRQPHLEPRPRKHDCSPPPRSRLTLGRFLLERGPPARDPTCFVEPARRWHRRSRKRETGQRQCDRRAQVERRSGRSRWHPSTAELPRHPDSAGRSRTSSRTTGTGDRDDRNAHPRGEVFGLPGLLRRGWRCRRRRRRPRRDRWGRCRRRWRSRGWRRRSRGWRRRSRGWRRRSRGWRRRSLRRPGVVGAGASGLRRRWGRCRVGGGHLHWSGREGGCRGIWGCCEA
jgi:hypothetical protein